MFEETNEYLFQTHREQLELSLVSQIGVALACNPGNAVEIANAVKTVLDILHPPVEVLTEADAAADLAGTPRPAK